MVLVLLGILVGIGLPRFFALRGFQSDFFFDDFVSALRYGQRLAVASGCPVEFRVTGSSFALSQRQSCTTGPFDRSVTHPGTGAPGYSASAPAGVSVTASPNPVVFDALGRALDASLAPSDASFSVDGRPVAVSAEMGFAFDPSN